MRLIHKHLSLYVMLTSLAAAVAEEPRDHTHAEQPRVDAANNGACAQPSNAAGADENTRQSYEQSGGTTT